MLLWYFYWILNFDSPLSLGRSWWYFDVRVYFFALFQRSWWRNRGRWCGWRFPGVLRIIRIIILPWFSFWNLIRFDPQLFLYDPFEGKFPQGSLILTCCIEFISSLPTFNHKWKRPTITFTFIIKAYICLILNFGL